MEDRKINLQFDVREKACQRARQPENGRGKRKIRNKTTNAFGVVGGPTLSPEDVYGRVGVGPRGKKSSDKMCGGVSSLLRFRGIEGKTRRAPLNGRVMRKFLNVVAESDPKQSPS